MSKPQKIRITSDENSIRKHIFIDDQEIFGVTAADLRLRPDEIPTLTLEISSTDIEVEDVECDALRKYIYKNDLLNMPIEYLKLTNRTYNALKRACVRGESLADHDRNETIGDVLKNYKSGRVRRYSHLGKKCLDEIRAVLTVCGLIGGDED